MLLPRIKQFGKIITSGVLFTFLGVGGFLCTLILRPILALLPGGVKVRNRRAGHAISFFFRLFVIGLSRSGILRVEAAGLEDPERLAGSIILANHPSYLDIVILIALLPGAVCVVKEGVWTNPFFGPIVRAAGFISNTGPEKVLEEGAEALASGRIMVIFPEGSRTLPGHPLKFHRGAAHLALRSGAPVLPVTITVAPPLLAKGHRWYHIPVATSLFTITAGQPFPCGATSREDPLFLHGARELTRALEAHYLKELHGTPCLPT